MITSKIPALVSQRPKRNILGMKKCNNCKICPYIKPGKFVKSNATDIKIEINKEVNCQTKNVIYCITCKKCNVQYIGETERTLMERFCEHLGYVHNENLGNSSVKIV